MCLWDRKRSVGYNGGRQLELALRQHRIFCGRPHITTSFSLLHTAMSDVVKLYDEADKLKAEGKLDEAVAKLEQAVNAKDSYALAHSALAVVLQRLGRHEEAIKHAVRVTELEPSDPFSRQPGASAPSRVTRLTTPNRALPP